MNASLPAPVFSPRSQADEVPVLLRGEVSSIRRWIEHWSGGRLLFHVAIIVIGMGAFGAAVGAWRAPMQAAYGAVKFPLIILLTTGANAILNGMLAPLLGTNLSFRQSLLAIVMSFAIAGLILGALSPLVLFLLWNAPPLQAGSNAQATHSFLLLLLVGMLAFAGVAGNARLLQLLRALCGDPRAGRRTLVAWLAGNLLLGSQLSWILRPFIGAPELPVEFLRRDAFHGNFFEMVYLAAKHLATTL